MADRPRCLLRGFAVFASKTNQRGRTEARSEDPRPRGVRVPWAHAPGGLKLSGTVSAPTSTQAAFAIWSFLPQERNRSLELFPRQDHAPRLHSPSVLLGGRASTRGRCLEQSSAGRESRWSPSPSSGGDARGWRRQPAGRRVPLRRLREAQLRGAACALGFLISPRSRAGFVAVAHIGSPSLPPAA